MLQPSGPPATLYEHGARAIDCSLASGAHGLPLMGGGDWNDGMNRVGPGGRGESVWLAWFLCQLVDGYAPLAEARGEPERAARWRAAAAGWRGALATQGWDGAWYRRAFFDDGTPLGTAAAAECRIDLVAQAWAVLGSDEPDPALAGAVEPGGSLAAEAGPGRGLEAAVDPRPGLAAEADPVRGLAAEADPGPGLAAEADRVRGLAAEAYRGRGLAAARARQAMASAAHELVDEPLGLLRLLHPPLALAKPSAGYIQAYPPGVRENGAQYSHAGAWAVLAWARLGEPARAWQAWQGLSPAHRAAHPVQGPPYGLEPYAMAADVCTAPPYAGRGGWSWYTGSAGVMLRAALEGLCGLQVRGSRLRLSPQLPPPWPGLTLRVSVAGQPWVLQLWRADAEDAVQRARDRGAVALRPGAWFDTGAPVSTHELLLVLPGGARTPTAPGPAPHRGPSEAVPPPSPPS